MPAVASGDTSYLVSWSGAPGGIWAREVAATGSFVGSPQQIFEQGPCNLCQTTYASSGGAGTFLVAGRSLIESDPRHRELFVTRRYAGGSTGQLDGPQTIYGSVPEESEPVVWDGTRYVTAWWTSTFGPAAMLARSISFGGIPEGQGVTQVSSVTYVAEAKGAVMASLGAGASLLAYVKDGSVRARILSSTASCGNSVLDTGELCDTGIPAGQPGACPTSCSDGKTCTTDSLPAGGTCLAECAFTPITGCLSGDGCCPSGCTANSDKDCAPVCGNGIYEPPTETCDTGLVWPQAGACPAS